jgi:hypothetical protein
MFLEIPMQCTWHLIIFHTCNMQLILNDKNYIIQVTFVKRLFYQNILNRVSKRKNFRRDTLDKEIGKKSAICRLPK